MPSVKEPGFADASMSLKNKEETKKTKKKWLGRQARVPEQPLCKITPAPAEQMMNSSLKIFPEIFRSL